MSQFPRLLVAFCIASFVTTFSLMAQENKKATIGDEEAAIQKDRKALAGMWRFILYKEDGVKATDESLNKSPVIIDTEGNMSTSDVDARTMIDPSKNPKRIDITYTKGKRYVGKTVWGIYEIQGDIYRICYAPPGENRPPEFTSKVGSGHVLMALKREKK